jgi:hypothetical protein
LGYGTMAYKFPYFGGIFAWIFNIDQGSRLLWNIGPYLANYTVLLSGRP